MSTLSLNPRTLSTFKIVMITMISVDSIRNLPMAAQYGMSLVTFYLIAGLAFFLPLALITSRFASEYPNTGGSYLWIEAAFGKKIGFLSVWLQWVYQIIWYPTIFAFIGTTLASLIHPAWETNPHFILLVSLGLFWAMTWMSSYGMRATSWMSSIGVILGTLLPMAFILGLAVFWLAKGHPSATDFSTRALIPNQNALDNLGFFANILFSLMGLEVVAMHAGNVKTPESSFRKAMKISGILILLSLILSSLALCTVISPNQIGLLNGLMAAFRAFLDQDHLGYLLPFVGIAIILGSLGTAFSWMIGLARGLQIACMDAGVFKGLHPRNAADMPHRVLLLQGVLYSILVAAFLLFPNVNNSYWLLSVLTSQFALLYYAVLFAAAMKLYTLKRPLGSRTLKGQLIERYLPSLAILTSLFGVFIGFLPPESIPAHGILKYELLLIAGLVGFCLPLLYVFKKIRL